MAIDSAVEMGINQEYVKEALVTGLEAALELRDTARVEALLSLIDEIPPGTLGAVPEGAGAAVPCRPGCARAGPGCGAAVQESLGGFSRELVLPFNLGVTELEHAGWLVSQGRAKEAEPLLAEASEIFERLGAQPWLERAGALAGTSAEPVPVSELTVRPAWRVSFAAVYRSSYFDRFSKRTARSSGHPVAFVAATRSSSAWARHRADLRLQRHLAARHQHGTTIVTFLMVFLIQNTQNRDAAAIQLKLDELIRATQGAHNALLDLEELSEAELEAFHRKYLELAEAARTEIRGGAADTGTPTVQFPSAG